MRSFGLVEDKLEEADFFLAKLEETDGNFFQAKHFFSAFVSAARSVTFALQGSLSDAPGFSEWYKTQQAALRQNRLARFFHECRTDAQHLGMNPVMGGSSGPKTKSVYWFDQPEPNRYKYIPNEDVVTACNLYMRLICELIDQAFVDFGILIDPDQLYTPAGLKQAGLTLEDVEERLGYPRGYTDISWEGGNKDLHRLSLLCGEIPRSSIKPLLVQHLGRELTYPDDGFYYRDDPNEG